MSEEKDERLDWLSTPLCLSLPLLSVSLCVRFSGGGDPQRERPVCRAAAGLQGGAAGESRGPGPHVQVPDHLGQDGKGSHPGHRQGHGLHDPALSPQQKVSELNFHCCPDS